MNHEFDVLIAGGGVVGLTAALAMAQRHYTVAVIDSGALTAVCSALPDPRVFAINKASQTLLAELGAWQHLDQSRVSPYQQMHVWDSINGAYIDFDSRDIAEARLGSIIEESVLKEALLRQIGAESNISLFAHSCVEDVYPREQGIQIRAQNKLWSGQLLLVADGAQSPTRQKLNVALTHWSYNQSALVATVHIEKSHQQRAYQVFHPDGPLAFLPLADPHCCSIVWSSEPARVRALMACEEELFNKEVTSAFAQELGQVRLIGARYHFPLHMRHVKHYVGKHWILLGDAAHTIHPLAGLGLNLGLADVRAWLRCLEQHQGALGLSKRLGAYQRERKHAVWQTILLMEGLKRAFSYSSPPLARLRGLGLRACNELLPLKRLFIQHAEG